MTLNEFQHAIHVLDDCKNMLPCYVLPCCIIYLPYKSNVSISAMKILDKYCVTGYTTVLSTLLKHVHYLKLERLK